MERKQFTAPKFGGVRVTFFSISPGLLLFRAQQIMPLKEALINDQPAAVSVSVMQWSPISSACVCVSGCVTERESVR